MLFWSNFSLIFLVLGMRTTLTLTLTIAYASPSLLTQLQPQPQPQIGVGSSGVVLRGARAEGEAAAVLLPGRLAAARCRDEGRAIPIPIHLLANILYYEGRQPQKRYE